MRIAWEACERMDPRSLRWSQCGPTLFSGIVDKCALHRYVAAPETFCPIHFSEWRKVLDPAAVWSFGPGTRSVHLWHELWRREAQDKNREYQSSCLYEILKRRYLCLSETRAPTGPDSLCSTG
jgi:hypothetical protein